MLSATTTVVYGLVAVNLTGPIPVNRAIADAALPVFSLINATIPTATTPESLADVTTPAYSLASALIPTLVSDAFADKANSTLSLTAASL